MERRRAVSGPLCVPMRTLRRRRWGSRGETRTSRQGAATPYGGGMRAVTLELPDDLDLALNVPADELAHAVLVAAAVKLFERGKISAGKAGELARVAKPLFFLALGEGGGGA